MAARRNPPFKSVFELKAGARGKLVDRSGSMVIVEKSKSPLDWIEWSQRSKRGIAAKGPR